MQHQPTAERMHPHVRPGAPPGHDCYIGLCGSLPFISLALSSLCVPADGRGRGQEINKTTAKQPLPTYFLSGVKKFMNFFNFYQFLQSFWPGFLYVSLFHTASPVAPQISMSRIMLGLSLGQLRLWHWQSWLLYNHSARTRPHFLIQ